jgi:hypothetical protein
VSAAPVGVSTGNVDVSAGDRVDGGLVESISGCSVLPLSLQAMMMDVTARMANNFFIVFILICELGKGDSHNIIRH